MDVGEVFATIARVRDGDAGSWYAARRATAGEDSVPLRFQSKTQALLRQKRPGGPEPSRLSLNAEVFPVFSSLPPGDLPSATLLVTP